VSYFSAFEDDFRLKFENEQDANTVVNFIVTAFSLSDKDSIEPPVVEELQIILLDTEYEFLKENKDVLDIELFEEG
jgi:hypothetical protein